MKKTARSVWVASAVASMFSVAAYAGDEPAKGKQHKETSEAVRCGGINECKGKSECDGPRNGCAGANECKGKGWVSVKSAKECTDKGGKVIAEKK